MPTYLNSIHVTKYVPLEPNVLMHDEIRRAANALGFTEATGSLVLACGAEDTIAILTCLGGYQPVNTIVFVLSLCSVPEPQETIRSLVTEVLNLVNNYSFSNTFEIPFPTLLSSRRFGLTYGY